MGHAQEAVEPQADAEPAGGVSELSPELDDEGRAVTLRRASKGVEYSGPDGRSTAHLWLRAQLRHSNPFDEDPRAPDDFETPPGSDFAVNRARLKAQGTLLNPRVGFYYEHELAGDPRLLDLRLDLSPREGLRVRIGQHKVLYNRERVDSSGQQQFVERSIATRAFTLDRQRGITLAGRLSAGRPADAWYFAGVFEGNGRDPDDSIDGGGGRMWVGRYQWNFAGEPLPFSQSDIDFREEQSGTLAVAAARAKGPYTRFSSAGGGQLDGFEPGSGDRYELEQWLQEFAWRFNGISVQQEYHVKKITDTLTGATSTLDGGYAQVGKAWRWHVGEWARPGEVALRYAHVDQRRAPTGDRQTEATLAFNLFFAGHDNKLTFDVSTLALDQAEGPTRRDTRYRLQWDVSF